MHQTVRIFLSAALIRGSRNAANPAGVPIVQSRSARNGVITALSPELRRHRQHGVDQAHQLLNTLQVVLAVRFAARHLGDHLVKVHVHHGIRVDQFLELGDHGAQPQSRASLRMRCS